MKKVFIVLALGLVSCKASEVKPVAQGKKEKVDFINLHGDELIMLPGLFPK